MHFVWPCSHYALCGPAATMPCVALQPLCLVWPCSHYALCGPAATMPCVALQPLCLVWPCSHYAWCGPAATMPCVALQPLCLVWPCSHYALCGPAATLPCVALQPLWFMCGPVHDHHMYMQFNKHNNPFYLQNRHTYCISMYLGRTGSSAKCTCLNSYTGLLLMAHSHGYTWPNHHLDAGF